MSTCQMSLEQTVGLEESSQSDARRLRLHSSELQIGCFPAEPFDLTILNGYLTCFLVNTGTFNRTSSLWCPPSI